MISPSSSRKSITGLSRPVSFLYGSYLPGLCVERQSNTYPPPLPDSSSGIPFLYEKLNTRTTSGPCPSYFDGVAVGFSMLVADCGLFFMSDAFAAELSSEN